MDEASKPSASRLGRTYRLARLATDASARVALGMAKKAVGSEEEARPRSLEEHRRIARRAVEILGGMKGLAMKAGQIVSYVDDWIPEDVRPAYAELLPTLQAKAPKVPLADMLNVFIDEVGEPPDEVFRSFDEEPIAAASIGQVYRAELPDGRPVAVKIQYPGIDEVIRSDLKNLGLLETVLRASTMGRFDVKQSLEDIKLKIGEELDYRREAANQRRFAEIYADHPRIVVPRVYDEYSHARVLTTELLGGRSYYEFIAASDQEEKNRTAETLYEFVFGSFHRHGIFNADPHPGNYVFLGDARVGFLDFGCVQEFPLEVPGNFRRLVQLLWAGRVDEVREGLPAALGYPGEASEEEKDFFLDYVGYLWRPILEDRSFTYDEAFVKEIFSNTKRGVKLSAKLTLTKGMPDTERRGLALLNRLQFGFVSILAGLRATSNWHRLIRDYFAYHTENQDGGGPPPPPLIAPEGEARGEEPA
ncbi:MAG: AarF/ABC1/UbiB kinase family protein [Planctomycetota bacterium]|nr:MAG: AarF/ABC1/UbiB kinase family protein [Planctomycetota bacterium]